MRITSPYQLGIGVLGLVWMTLNWYTFLTTGRPLEHVEPWSLLLLTVGLSIYQLTIDEGATGVLLFLLAVVFYVDSRRVPTGEDSSDST